MVWEQEGFTLANGFNPWLDGYLGLAYSERTSWEGCAGLSTVARKLVQRQEDALRKQPAPFPVIFFLLPGPTP